jgi:hypothetical protein
MPDVIPGREHVDAGGKEIASATRIDADAPARILTVGDQQIGALARRQRLRAQLQSLAPRFADHVAEVEDLHSFPPALAAALVIGPPPTLASRG